MCPDARFTGYQIDGGYAEYALADARYCFSIHGDYADAEAAPLLEEAGHLVDLDQLLRSFGEDPVFWGDLVEEAAALDLTRPAYYALRYAHRWFDTPVPGRVTAQTSAWAPPEPIRRLMDALVERTIPQGFRNTSQTAVFALYVRSHWLRMPPLQVVRHLARKSVRTR